MLYRLHVSDKLFAVSHRRNVFHFWFRRMLNWLPYRLAVGNIEQGCDRIGIITEVVTEIAGSDRIGTMLRNQIFLRVGRRILLHRLKLRLLAGEHRFDALHEFASRDRRCVHIVCCIKRYRLVTGRIVNGEFAQQLVFKIEFGLATLYRLLRYGRSNVGWPILLPNQTRQLRQGIVVVEFFCPVVPVIRDIFIDHYVFHHLRVKALASVL
ncbi:hypothetical protein RRU01S_14_02740 [Agrobacterium rubi TR3 = NBRC 13261]|uniref:Uncharacterized protein n=1 Tax=Agrobacterium rubi TR3 = NBRC 13261 TaxID=1368415 RepID=A0A081CWK4_9HYPH|nr:hypothetical protein RRU01S_14_02740 [Agrobacterium rubi TR3 = NBRC 13261]